MQPCKSSVEEEKMWRSPWIIFRGITVFISVSEREGTKPNRESDIDYEQAKERDVRIKLIYIKFTEQQVRMHAHRHTHTQLIIYTSPDWSHGARCRAPCFTAGYVNVQQQNKNPQKLKEPTSSPSSCRYMFNYFCSFFL